jgi:hypothetical protein
MGIVSGMRFAPRVPCLTLVGCLACVVSAPAGAQTGQEPASVQEILAFLVTNHGVPTSDFDRDRDAAEATRATLTRALLSAISQVPISTSSSGFTYRFNPSLGTVERASQTFGPFFVERAITSGGGQASFGVTFQYSSFTSLDGNNLRDGSFVTVANRFRDEPDPFDVETLTLNISTRTATVFGSLGVTDRLDISAAVPLVSMSISGSRQTTYRGRTLLQARASATTVGLADMAVRSKYRFTPDGPVTGAAAVEVRLPTGREEDLLGAGETAVRLLGIASADTGPASVHGSVAMGFGGLGGEWSSGAAVSYAATPRLTMVGEMLLRRAAGAERVVELIAPHPRIAGVETLRLVPAGDRQLTATTVVGFKWNIAGTWLLHGNVLVPVGQRGLTTRFAPSVALDYSFTR